MAASIGRGERQARDLPERVHAGVGASGAGDRDRRVLSSSRERVFEQALDRGAGRLPLPADEARAVVGERQLEGWQRIITRPRAVSLA